MAEQFVRREERTDHAGAYTAYVYADGHVETDPAGRPLSREDMQRLRLAEAVAEQVRNMTTALRTARSSGEASVAPESVRRAEAQLPVLRLLTQDFHDTVNAIGELAVTARTPRGLRQQLVENFDLGGVVVGDRRGLRPELGEEDVPDRRPNLSTVRRPLQRRRVR